MLVSVFPARACVLHRLLILQCSLCPPHCCRGDRGALPSPAGLGSGNTTSKSGWEGVVQSPPTCWRCIEDGQTGEIRQLCRCVATSHHNPTPHLPPPAGSPPCCCDRSPTEHDVNLCTQPLTLLATRMHACRNIKDTMRPPRGDFLPPPRR